MRICFISAGAFAHVGPYLDFFKSAGHDVDFIALSPSPPRAVRVHDVALGGEYSPVSGKWKYPLSMLLARRLVARLKPDVVHTHYATSGGLAGLVCGFRPTIVTAHGTDLTKGFESPVWRPLLKAIFAQAARVNTVSADLTSKAVSLGVAPEKVLEMTLGIDTVRFHGGGRRPPRPGEPLRLLCTRRLEAVFDHPTIVSALAILKAKGVRFKMTFAGEGSLRSEVVALVERRGLGAAVSFLGAVAATDMPGLLQEHDVFLSASRWDGTSLSLLEAMASGLVPVVSRIPANEAWLEHGAGGFMHRLGDPEDLAGRVLQLARRPELAALAPALNRARVLAAGDRMTNMRRLEGVYEGLVRGARSSARQ